MTEPSEPLSPNRRPTREGIERAAKKIAAILPPTPLMPLRHDGQLLWCKAECLQPIGAFKIRGAWHRLTDFDEDEQKRGIVAFSSGNHGLGVAWAAKRLGIKATIVMPSDAPQRKRSAIEGYGASVVEYDRRTGNRVEIAERLARKTGAIVVPSFDDPWIIEGQGSTGLEAAVQIVAQAGVVPDRVIVCCGGGGLAAGIALGLPGVKISLVEPEGWDDMAQSLKQKAIVPVGADAPDTACDALQTPRVSELTFNILRERKAEAVTVSDAEAFAAMRFAHERLRLVLEPGGAVALAAVLTGKVTYDDRTIIMLTGGNVDPALFARALSAV